MPRLKTFIVAVICFAIVFVDFRSWFMSFVVESLFIGLLLAVYVYMPDKEKKDNAASDCKCKAC